MITLLLQLIPKFEWSLTFGNSVTFVMVAGGIWRIETWGRRLFTEHEILVRDYCERKGIKLRDLPTRFKLGAS